MDKLLDKTSDVNTLSAGALAFVGDAVFTLFVREHLAAINRPAGILHSMSVKYVNAVAQAGAYKKIEPLLSDKEIAVYKRGRNSSTNNTPKNASEGQYHSATGLEALFGYLYLNNEIERLRELFLVICEDF